MRLRGLIRRVILCVSVSMMLLTMTGVCFAETEAGGTRNSPSASEKINPIQPKKQTAHETFSQSMSRETTIQHLRKRIQQLEEEVARLKSRLNELDENMRNHENEEGDLVAYWSLDEKGGTTSYDLSGNGHQLMNHGAKVGVEAVSGTGYEFDGEDDYLRSKSTDLINSPSWSISFWVKAFRGNNSTGEGFVSQGYTGNKIGLGNWSRSFVFNGDRSPKGGRLDLFKDEVIRDGEFHHVVVIFDRGDFKVYVDQELKIDRDINVDHYNWTTNQLPLFVASSGGKGNFFKGLMDEIRIYRIALDQETINQLRTLNQ